MKRVFLLLGGALLFGCFAASLSTSVRMMGILLLITVVAVCYLWQVRSFRWGLVAAACLWLGFGAYTVKEAYYAPLAAYDQQTLMVSGIIESEVRKPNGRYQYLLRTTLDERSFLLQLTASGEILDAEIGDSISASCLVYAPSSGYWFDSERSYHSQNIWLTGYLAEPDQAVVTKGTKLSFPLMLARTTQRYREALQNNTKLSREVSGVLQSMVLGDRTNLDAAIEQSYTNAGVSHLFAVSGMHLMAFIGIFLWIIPKRHRWMRLGAAVFLTVVFTLVTGGHLSTVRSGVMLVMQLLAPCFHRSNDGINTLFFTGFAMALCDPFVVLDLGFLLSFSAMFGLVVFYPAVRRLLKKHAVSPIFQPILQVLAATFCVQAAVFPVTLWQFGCVSLMAPFGNLLLVPLLAPIIVLGALYVLLLPVADCTPLRLVVSLLIEAEDRLAQWLGSVHWTMIGLNDPCYRVWAALVLLGIGLAFFLQKSSSAWRIARYLVLLFVLFVGIAQYRLVREQSLYIVADGECANLILNDQGEITILATGDNNWVDATTLRFLQSKGISTVNTYIQLEPVLSAVDDTRRLSCGVTIEEYCYPEEGMAPQNLSVGKLQPLSYGTELSFMGGSKLFLPGESSGVSAILSAAGVNFWIGKASSLEYAPESAVLFLTSLSGQEALYANHFCVLIQSYGRQYPEAEYLDATEGVTCFVLKPQGFALVQ